MGEVFRLGGWGMYPTTLIGILLLGFTVIYMLRPAGRRLGVVASLGVLTLLSGSLGFVTGVIKTLQGAGMHRFNGSSVDIAMIGVSESLHNVSLALAVLVLASIGVAVGVGRRARA